VVSASLEAVFDDPYEMVVRFVQRRNKTECDLKFKRGQYEIDPLFASGGGAVDVAAFALRVASWSMQTPRSRPVLILDEPFRYLSPNLLPRASEMVKRISEELGIQIIMISHSDELIDSADKAFAVRKVRDRSVVE
jgi:DNA repair exonuclease SbcCD ATPase subunit